MTQKDRDIIEHIIYRCNRLCITIDEFGDSFEKFDSSENFQELVSFNIAQIGELVKSLSDGFRNSTSDQIPWKNIAGMRDHLVHGYTTMKKRQIWDTALDDIPPLKKFCEEQLERYGNEIPT